MAKSYVFSQEQIAEIEAARKRNKHKSVEKRLRVLALRAEGVKRADVAAVTGFTINHISDLVAKYHKDGLCGIAGNNYKGNRRLLSFEQEKTILDTFEEKAAKGQVVKVSEIKAAYEKEIGRSLDDDKSQIYRVLKRHGWRKVMPRSKHPNKASDEVIETSKKLTKPSEMQWQKITFMEESD